MNLTKEEKLEEIIRITKENNITKYTIAKNTKVSEAGVGKILNKTSKNPRETTVDNIYNYLFSNTKLQDVKEDNQIGVPCYETEVTSSIVASFSDVPETPSYYVNYKPFNDCTAYVTNFGDSMFPKYKNGEKLAVKQIFNLDVISWGETYLIITNGNANDLKTVKDVHFNEDNTKITLRASNPSYKGDTPINKEDIISMFAIKGKISQNFN